MTDTAPLQTVLSSDQIEHLVTMATYAPSVHNTQPWTLRAVEGGLDLWRDRSRQLGAIDPHGRELLLSCGALLHHLEVAARALGLDAATTLDLDGDHVARVELRAGAGASEHEAAAAVAILHRHTWRGRFDETPVSAGELDRLRRAAEGQGGMLRVVRDEELTGVEVLLSRAEAALHRVDGYDDELRQWVWDGTADVTRGDGLPRAAVDHGRDRAESLVGREFDGPLTPPVEPPPAERASVVLLSSPTDGPADWVQAGRALSALLLTATGCGLVAQPLGQVLDLPAPRLSLARLLGTVGAPQMLLRLGHGSAAPQTPRRPVGEVLTR